MCEGERDGRQYGSRMTGPRKEGTVRGVDPQDDDERESGPCERRRINGKARTHSAVRE